MMSCITLIVEAIQSKNNEKNHKAESDQERNKNIPHTIQNDVL